jgi:hypothetical protein
MQEKVRVSFRQWKISRTRTNWRRYCQYDHIIPYSKGGETTPDNLETTHPFCNNMREEIEAYRKDPGSLGVPIYRKTRQRPEQEVTQLALDFPDE